MGDLRKLAPLYRPYLGWITLSVLASVVAALAGAGLMAVSGGFIAAMAVAGGAGVGMNYFTPSALVRLFAILRTGARYGERVIGHEATLRIVAEARGFLFARLAPLAPGALADLHSGEVLARLKSDIERLETVFLRAASPMAAAAATTLLIAAFVLLYDARIAALFVALAALAGLLAPLAFAGRLRRALAESARLNGERRSALVDALDGLAELLVSGAYAERAAAAQAQLAAQLACEAREHAALAWTQSAAALAADLAMLGALALGWLAIRDGRLAAPDVSMLTLLVASGFEPLTALPAAFAALPAAAASISRVLDLAGRRPLVADPPAPAPAPSGFDIALKGVSYAYARAPVLSDVSLTIPERASVAIVGGSGAGKTTLIDLLLRVRDPDKGEVRIGGAPAQSLSLETLRGLFAVAPQFPHLFDRSLSDNLRLGAPEAGEAEMRQALALVGLEPWLDGLPEGLSADVGPLGAKLSVGQARRVAIARALLAKGPILLLDEPTEGLDADNERRLIDNILAATPERTVIAITHSEEARARFGRVLTVGDGGVSEA
jgi:ATP-binding cassette subfamily C protein CydC